MMNILSLLAPPKPTRSLLTSPASIFSAAISLRAVMLLYGIYQDNHATGAGAVKYTDVDYYVFTDAARYVAHGHSPYARDTYRYTPLLAWVLVPTTWRPQWVWFGFGKALFAACDIVAGWLMFVVLRRRGVGGRRRRRRRRRREGGGGGEGGGDMDGAAAALGYSAIWLLNPMVATISTRGSSEGLLCVMVMALLWATEVRRIAVAGLLLGASVHLKIYPFIYGVSILLSLEEVSLPSPSSSSSSSSSSGYPAVTSVAAAMQYLSTFLNRDRLVLIFMSLATFSILNMSMYAVYGIPFMEHTYLHHLTRIDHRHNFSVYNTLLHLSSGGGSSTPKTTTGGLVNLEFESLAFIPQLLLSTLLIPLAIQSRSRSQSQTTSTSTSSLPTTMLAQTFAFVTFNKVCTSQYFLWYLVFLPIYLPDSVLMRNPTLGLTVLGAWVAGQALWLWHAYRLEMLGTSTFVPALWLSGLAFFAVNCWILGVIVTDGGRPQHDHQVSTDVKRPKQQEEVAAGSTVSRAQQRDDDDDGDSDIEEIVRDRTVDEMVREGKMMSKRGGGGGGGWDHRNERPVVGVAGNRHGHGRQSRADVDQETMLRDYMAEIQDFMAHSPE